MNSGNSSRKRIIGIDPGLANTGFGIIDYTKNQYKLVKYGVIETAPDLPYSYRLLTLYTRLFSIISEYKPCEAAMERLFFSRNIKSAMDVAQAQGVISLCFAQYNISLVEYTPNQIKKAVTGSTTADKKLVEKYVKLLLGLETEPKPDHAADALAASITHFHYTGGI